MTGVATKGPGFDVKQFVSRNLSNDSRKSARRYFWALSTCEHCRKWAPMTTVYSCCNMGAHHREVALVTAQDARKSIGVLCPASEQLLQRDLLLPATRRGQVKLGTIFDLDPDNSTPADDNICFVVSCEECAGLPLEHCIDKGHVQLERPAGKLPEKTMRRARQVNKPQPKRRRSLPPANKASSPTSESGAVTATAKAAGAKAGGEMKKTMAAGAGQGAPCGEGRGGGKRKRKKRGVDEEQENTTPTPVGVSSRGRQEMAGNAGRSNSTKVEARPPSQLAPVSAATSASTATAGAATPKIPAAEMEAGEGGGGTQKSKSGGGRDKRKRVPRKAPNCGRREESRGADGPSESRAKRTKVGVGAARAAVAAAVKPMVVESSPSMNTASRVEEVGAPVPVTDTDGEREVEPLRARDGERWGGGSGSGPSVPRPSCESSPISSSPSFVVGEVKVAPKPQKLTSKSLGKDDADADADADAALVSSDSDAALRTTAMPSSASSSCSMSSASSAAPCAHTAAGGSSSGDTESGDKRGRTRHAGGQRTAEIGAGSKGAPPEAGGAVLSCSSSRSTTAPIFASASCSPSPSSCASASVSAAAAAPVPSTDLFCAAGRLSMSLSTTAIVSCVAAAANQQQCTEKKVWLATFLECQRRELEGTKESCRRELEALKQKLRARMRDAEDLQAKAREEFCGRLYGTDAAAALATVPVRPDLK